MKTDIAIKSLTTFLISLFIIITFVVIIISITKLFFSPKQRMLILFNKLVHGEIPEKIEIYPNYDILYDTKTKKWYLIKFEMCDVYSGDGWDIKCKDRRYYGIAFTFDTVALRALNEFGYDKGIYCAKYYVEFFIPIKIIKEEKGDFRLKISEDFEAYRFISLKNIKLKNDKLGRFLDELGKFLESEDRVKDFSDVEVGQRVCGCEQIVPGTACIPKFCPIECKDVIGDMKKVLKEYIGGRVIINKWEVS